MLFMEQEEKLSCSLLGNILGRKMELHAYRSYLLHTDIAVNYEKVVRTWESTGNF
jgi:hypothetical protein